MRRMTIVCGLVCVLALGGWGQVSARVACTHAAAAAVAATDEHACCRAKLTQPADHCHAAVAEHHASAPAHETHHEDGAAAEAQANFLHQSDPFCAHCVMRSAPTVGVVRAQTASARAAAVQAVAARQAYAPAPVRVSPVEPLQHAPPARARRHLLSTLLI
jgi:hypothetical protein